MSKFSRIGFVLAAAGSAVGLGNIWKFPYVTGEYGGGAFVLVYLVATIFVGLVIFIIESLIGQHSEKNVCASFVEMSKSNNPTWKYAGFVMFTGLITLSFYSVVLGWILNYIVSSFFSLPTETKVAASAFGNLIKDVGLQLFCYTVIAITVIFIVLKGIKDGIERINLILMPLLGIILIGLLIYSIYLDSFSKAMSFMFVPDWSKINGNALLVALGQAFFSLSLSAGVIITYSASLPKNANFIKTSISVVFINTMVSLIAGIIIFSFLFSAGASSSQGPGLVFISLPVIFSQWGTLGHIIAVLFFIALIFAGITSAISMIEPFLMYLIERYKMTRKKAMVIAGSAFYVLGVIALLSMSNSWKGALTFFGKNAFDWMDFIVSSILMPIGGIVACIFVGYYVDRKLLEDKFTQYTSLLVFNIWYSLVRYIIPIAVLIIFINKLGFI